MNQSGFHGSCEVYVMFTVGKSSVFHSESMGEVCHFFQWDFQGSPKMGPPYGKLPILFPYHSHKNPLR